MGRDVKAERSHKKEEPIMRISNTSTGNRNSIPADDDDDDDSSSIDENTKPFARFMGKFRFRSPKPISLSGGGASNSSNNSSSTSSSTVITRPPPPPASPSNLSILEDLLVNPAPSTTPTRLANTKGEPANLQILKDLEQSATTVPTTKEHAVATTGTPSRARHSTTATAARAIHKEGKRIKDQIAQGDILDAIVDTTSTKTFHNRGAGKEALVEEGATATTTRQYGSNKKGMKQQGILQDLASAEEKWMQEHRIII